MSKEIPKVLGSNKQVTITIQMAYLSNEQS